MTPEEHKRRGDAADALFREMKRQIAPKVGSTRVALGKRGPSDWCKLGPPCRAGPVSFVSIEAEWPGCAEPQSGRAYGR